MAPNDWKEDFKDFANSGESPPRNISDSIRGRVHQALHPSLERVIAKLLPVQLLAGALTLLICPQLGVGAALFGPHGLVMPLFMPLGDLACAGLCGALYLSLSTALGLAFLTKEEVRAVSERGYLHITVLVAVSFAGLMLSGGAGGRLEYVVWLVGAGLGGWLAAKGSAYWRWKGFSRRLTP